MYFLVRKTEGEVTILWDGLLGCSILAIYWEHSRKKVVMDGYDLGFLIQMIHIYIWKSSYCSRWRFVEGRVRDIDENGSDWGFVGDKDSFILLVPVDTGKSFGKVDTK